MTAVDIAARLVACGVPDVEAACSRQPVKVTAAEITARLVARGVPEAEAKNYAESLADAHARRFDLGGLKALQLWDAGYRCACAAWIESAWKFTGSWSGVLSVHCATCGQAVMECAYDTVTVTGRSSEAAP